MGGVEKKTPPQIPYPAGTAPFEHELWRDQLRQVFILKKLVDKIETQTQGS